jgi:uncharacterized membrane protein
MCTVPWRRRGWRLLACLACVALLLVPAPAAAQQAPLVSTPYPAVAVAAGEQASFDLRVTAPNPQRVDLSVGQVPTGWTARLRGGGFVVDGVFADPADPPELTLEVDVPADAPPGPQELVVSARAGAATATLPLTLRVAEEAAGSVALTAEFPSLRGGSDTTYTFDLELANDRPEEQTFSLEAAGPQRWQVTARPSSEEQASTATVPGGESANVTVEVDPPDDVPAGRYPVVVRATGGGRTVETELAVEITGSYALTLTTPDERLDLDAVAGRPAEVALVLRNDGTAPLAGLELTADAPADWDVVFEPATVEALPPGETAEVAARITPTDDAVAGDYVVSVDARAEQAEAGAELRTTVETSPWWGAVGLSLIVAALGALGAVFRRYGRR